MDEDVAALMGTRTEDGDRLSFAWGEPDAYGVSELVVTRQTENPDLADETLFLTSNSRIYDAFQRVYRNDVEYATDLARHLIRRLIIPSVEEVQE